MLLAARRVLRPSRALSTRPRRRSGEMFDKILVANRGEIACRVMRTARELGVKTVAVYSEADRDAMHVSMADEAYCIGPAAAASSYLCGDRIIDAMKRSGAEAVHPGYGFLSENAAFARAVAQEGLTFIGPPADAIEAMGCKSASKAIMAAAGVPLVPGYHGDEQGDAFLEAEAARIGFPLLIKAALGGGGKGMRVVHGAAAFREALESCRREARQAFGDERVLLERYLSAPRHVEVQVFGDRRGNTVYLHERDCSVQRRHQKVLEEAPAPHLSPAQRTFVGEAAVKAARAVSYEGAGTVEFLQCGASGDFFFCEMNTRLQVEHPVTELITGLDLVAWQLRVACGQDLPIAAQEAVPEPRGHAVEARVYAENPARGFLPATGALRRLREPAGPGVRVDTGVREGDEVSVFYDPMVAKLLCHAPTRAEALRSLDSALAAYEVSGVATNLQFLKLCAAHEAFRRGGVSTAFLEDHGDAILRTIADDAPPPHHATAAAALALLLSAHGRARRGAAGRGNAFRAAGAARTALSLQVAHGEAPRPLPIVAEALRDGAFLLRFGGEEVLARGAMDADGRLTAEVDGRRYALSAAVHLHGSDLREGAEVDVFFGADGPIGADGRSAWSFAAPARSFDAAGAIGGGARRVTAPMPGRVVAVRVESGAAVKAGDALVVLEAMKMEHTLTAPADATVESVACSIGESVADGAALVELSAPAEELRAA